MERYKIYIKNIMWILEKPFFIYNFNKKIKKVSKNLNDVKVPVYVISRDAKVGLFSYVETTMRKIAYAIEHEMIPYVDYRNFENTYINDNEKERINMWELFFEQPFENNVPLKNRKLVYCKEEDDVNISYHWYFTLYKKNRYFYRRIYNLFFKLNKTSNNYFRNEYEELLKCDGTEVLGVLVRGTDIMYAKGHSIQPEIEEILCKTKKIFESKGYKKIYLATEEYKTVERFKEAFGDDIILTNKRKYYDGFDFQKGKLIGEIYFDRPDDKYKRGLEYLSSIMLLANCGGLIAGKCGGSTAAYYINNGKYKDVYIYYLGVNK